MYGMPSVGEAVVERLHDVRALHLRRRRGLAREALGRFLAVLEAARDELHDDLRAKREVIGDPDRTHPALAERADELDAGRHHHPRVRLGHEERMRERPIFRNIFGRM